MIVPSEVVYRVGNAVALFEAVDCGNVGMIQRNSVVG